MNRTALLLLIILHSISGLTQVKSLGMDPKQTWVTATDAELCFGSAYMMILHPNFKSLPVADSIIKQIGYKEFERVLQFSSQETYPEAMQIYHDGNILAKNDRKLLKQKMAKLNMLKIATFKDNVRTNAILRVPYSVNSDWDSAAKWDTIYFIVDDKYLKKRD